MTYTFDLYTTAPSPRPGEGDAFTLIGDAARQAEKTGHQGMLVFSKHDYLDPWVVAGAILQQTTTLVPLVAAQPASAPPHTVAKTVHSLAGLYGRRIDLNLVTGAAAVELERIGDTLSHDERYERAAEYMTLIRTVLGTGARVEHRGAYYHAHGLDIGAALPPRLQPRVFVAGSSPAADRVARQVAHVAVTHPEPLDAFAAGLARRPPGGPAIGARFGLIARPTAAQAWAAAHEQYQPDAYSRARLAMMRRSQSHWNRTLAELATRQELYDDVYWTGTLRSGKGGFPLLVGDYDTVAGYLGRYLAAGVGVLITGGVRTAEDFHHADMVFRELRDPREGTGT